MHASSDAATIRAGLRCGVSGCPCASERGNVHCPAHEDPKPSLSVKKGHDVEVVFKCFGGCTQEAVRAALRAKGLWQGGGGISPSVIPVTPLHPNTAKATHGSVTPGVTPLQGLSGKGAVEGVTPPTGLTLADLAKAKQLDVPFLQSLGLREQRYNGAPAVRIPYSDAQGNEIAVRFRVSLKVEPRFRWRRGDKTSLYGLERLGEIRRAAWVLLVEGESDCWTLWQAGLPVLGIPGKSTWRNEWAAYLQGLRVYLWQEPEAEDLVEKIAHDIPDVQIIVAPQGIKDPCEAHIQGVNLTAFLEELRGKAVSAKSIKRRKVDAELIDLLKLAAPVIESPDPLECVKREIVRLGYGGDIRPAVMTYLAATSRLLAMRPGTTPVHLLLVGPPSVGKSYTWTVVSRLLPPEAYWLIDAGSPRVLIYDTQELRHRVLVFGEADSLPSGEDNPAASAVRNLLQDNYLHYQATIRDSETGQFRVQDVSKEGPTVLITTSTRSLGKQLMTRLFPQEVPYDKEQIGSALAAQANLEKNGVRAPDATLVAFQSYLQKCAPWDVSVPFVEFLANEIAKVVDDPAILRAFGRVLSLTKAVCVLRHAQRQKDSAGRLVAEVEDYAVVYELLRDVYSAAATGASADVRKVVKAVAELRGKTPLPSPLSQTELAKHLKISKMGVSRRVTTALKFGWLVNTEIRKGYPANLDCGEPLPDDVALPKPEAVTCNTVPSRNGSGVTPLPAMAPNMDDQGRNGVTRKTANEIPPSPPTPEGQTPCGVAAQVPDGVDGASDTVEV